VTPASALFYNLCVQSVTQLLHVSALLSRHLQGADTTISTAVQQFTINIRVLWRLPSVVHWVRGLIV